jgi:glutamyl endopeptidase
MKDPRDLPDTPVDFRRYAKAVTTGEGWADEVRYALDDDVRTRAIVFGGESLPAPLPTAPKRDIGSVLEIGIQAAEEAAADPDTPLSPDRDAALEAVVRLRERPALLVQKNDFPEPPDRWRHLNQFRESIRGRLPCTGRIDSPSGKMVGTGFLVADDLVMTNRHVCEFFAGPPPVPEANWEIFAHAQPTIDFKMEHDEPEHRIFAIQSVVGVHLLQDVALLRVARQAIEPAGASLPTPVALAGPGVAPGTDLYAVGYPYVDKENATPPELIRAIFHDIFQVKRLQPGQFQSMFPKYGVFSHDCSTLGGNSGSGIVDVVSNLIVGIHYKGKYRQANFAVAMWLLHDDDLFKDRGVNFRGAK